MGMVELGVGYLDGKYTFADFGSSEALSARQIRRKIREEKPDAVNLYPAKGVPRKDLAEYFSKKVKGAGLGSKFTSASTWLGSLTSVSSPGYALWWINEQRKEVCVETRWEEHCTDWDSRGNCFGWGGQEICTETAMESFGDVFRDHKPFFYSMVVLGVAGLGLAVNWLRYTVGRNKLAKNTEVRILSGRNSRRRSQTHWEDHIVSSGLETRVEDSAWEHQYEDQSIYHDHYAGEDFEEEQTVVSEMSDEEKQTLTALGDKLGIRPELGEDPQDYKNRLQSAVEGEKSELLQKLKNIERRLNGRN